MNYYPFHIGDYVSATRHLSWDEDAAYRRLLDAYYTHEKPLPLEIRAVIRLVLASTDAQREAVETVLNEFFERTDSGWVNKRADAEILNMKSKQQKQRDNANMRWQKPRTEPGNATAMPQHQKSDAVASTPAPKKGVGARSATAQQPPQRPDDVDEQTWVDWLSLRKNKKAPVSQTVLNQARSESEKAGLTLCEFLQIWCARGSQGLTAEWLKPQIERAPAQRSGIRSGISFAQQDDQARRARWEEMTGRQWPAESPGDRQGWISSEDIFSESPKGLLNEPAEQSH